MTKKFSYKNIFYILFAICTLFAGFYAIQKSNSLNIANAEIEAETNYDNVSPNLQYLNKVEYIKNSASTSPAGKDSLMDSDIFSFYKTASTENYLQFSLKTNSSVTETDDVMHYVYYPNTSDQNNFLYYTNIHAELTLNGINVLTGTNADKKFVPEDQSLYFENHPGVLAQSFDMILNATGENNNEISVLDESGNVREGLYHLKLQIDIVNVSINAAGEQSFLDNPTIFIDYSFFVVDRNSYFSNNLPKIDNANFDHTISTTNVSSNASYYLYSNYSAKNVENSFNKVEKNGIPYLKFDSDRYDVLITKSVNNANYTASVKYDTELDESLEGPIHKIAVESQFNLPTKTILENGQQKTYIYFQDVGNYTITLNAIKIVNSKKYALTGISNITKNLYAYMYGIQFNYTDLDAEPDTFNVQPKSELKKLDTNLNLFTNNADITSEFLNSSEGFNQNSLSNEAGRTTFIEANILNYVDNHYLEDGKYKNIVTTNQTPIEITSNATLLPNESFVYSKNKNIADGWKETNTNNYFYKNFLGRAIDEDGIYIYLAAYTFSSYRDSENSFAQDRIYYQLFLFEINKTTPEIIIETQDSQKELYNLQSTNEKVSVKLASTTNSYGRDLTLVIYATDFQNGNFLEEFNYNTGKSLSEFGSEEVLLETNAHYYVRLYYSSDLKQEGVSTNFEMGDVAALEVEFIIDNTPIDKNSIVIHNIVQNPNTQAYRIVSNLDGFSTNQMVALSWGEKLSGIKTYAYYRKFELKTTNMYSNNPENLDSFINAMIQDGLPANNTVEITNSSWLKYASNTYSTTGNVPVENVIKSAGLYFVDFYDEAGNHTYDAFMIDTSTPVLSIFNQATSAWSLVTNTTFIDANSTLNWGDRKNILVNGLDSKLFEKVDEITEADLQASSNNYVYKDKDGNININIFNLIYNNFYKSTNTNGIFRLINPNKSISSNEGIGVTNYKGIYIGIPILDTYYYKDDANPLWTRKTASSNHHRIDLAAVENTYGVLIRDASNTEHFSYDANQSSYEQQDYVNYYSAYATIIVSFDESNFFISYESSSNGETTTNYLTSSFKETGLESVDGLAEQQNTLTTYINPTKLENCLKVQFTPTSNSQDEEGDKTIQIDEVSVQYFEFVKRNKTLNGEEPAYNGNYYDFETESSVSPQILYKFDNNPNFDESFAIDLNPDTSLNITQPGKYVITRNYKVGENFTFNTNDYYRRTYVLIVDRFEVITNPESTNTNLNKSYVGGEIFVSVFDNGNHADLVVSFPDNDANNPNSTAAFGRSLYNNQDEEIINIVQETNKLPVNLYVPTFKYTKFVVKNLDDIQDDLAVQNGRYHFSVENNDAVNIYKNENSEYELIIPEYVMFAQIRKVVRNSDGSINYSSSPIIASTSSSIISAVEGKIVVDNSKISNGFLNFYNADGSLFKGITTEGVYHVTVSQGIFGVGIGENSFQQSMTFQFQVNSATPDFQVRQQQNILVSDIQNGVETYYTNQPELILSWQRARNDYEIEIDYNNTTFSTSKNKTETLLKKDDDDNPISQENNSYLVYLDLTDVKGENIYENGAYIDITMQFKNHDDAKDSNGNNLYKKIKKRIVVDLEAPSDNVETLVSNSISTTFANNIDKSALREYKKAFGTTSPKDLSETSYNISRRDGDFRYYSYMVQTNYINTLRQTSDYKVYVKDFLDDQNANYKYDMENHSQDQETDYERFSASGFQDITENRDFEFNVGQYYEVVERDRAGNMAIYTVFVTSYNSNNLQENLIEYSPYKNYNEEDATGLTSAYTIYDYNQAKAEAGSRGGAVHNIYSKLGFEIKNINYFGDAWSQIQINGVNSDNYRVSMLLMKSPYYEDGLLLFRADGTIERMPYENLLDGTFNYYMKASIFIFNREKGNRASDNIDTFYVFVNSRMTLNYNTTQNQDEEYLEITNQSTTEQILNTTLGSVYLTKMEISVNGNQIYEMENMNGFTNSTAQGVTPWSNSTLYPYVTVTLNMSNLKFDITKLATLTANSAVLYKFYDNFGGSYEILHYFKDPIISQEVTSTGYELYKYQEENGKEIYIAQDNIQFNFNANKYKVEINLFENGDYQLQNLASNRNYRAQVDGQVTSIPNGEFAFNRIISSQGEITIWTFTHNGYSNIFSDDFGYNLQFKLVVSSNDTNYLSKRDIYFTLYNQLPTPNTNENSIENKEGEFKITNARGNNITADIISKAHLENYYSEVTIQYNKASTFMPIKYMISKNRTNWREIASGETFRCTSDTMENWYIKIWYDESYLPTVGGYNSAFVFAGEEANEYIYQFNLSPLTANYWVVRTDTNTIIERSPNSYTSPDGITYQIHYIVNMRYSKNNPIEIRLNQEQNLKTVLINEDQPFDNGNNVYSQLWQIQTQDNSVFANIIISYVPNVSEIVEYFYATEENRDIGTKNLKEYLSETLIVENTENDLNKDFDRMTLQWSRWYGFKENEILIEISKDDIVINPTVFYKKQTMNINGEAKEVEFSYIILTNSGKYSIRFRDLAGNVQRFNVGKEERLTTFTFTFLKDVPFKVSWNNGESESAQTILIDQQVFNGPVTLHIDPNTRTEYFSPNAVTISVKRNGEEYVDESFTDTTNDFRFTRPGHYEFSFSAESADPNHEAIRIQNYSFSIINPNENKIAYVFNKYASYYVEKVLRDDVDITDRLIKTMDIDLIKGQNGKDYLSMLPISYLDEKTGSGRYEITINSNNKFMQDMFTRYTFTLNIKSPQDAPISISVAEGKTTTKNIRVTFNAQNIYNQFGECSYRIIRENKNGTFSIMISSQHDITASSTEEISSVIDSAGTYYIQFITPSEYLLFSYKVIQKAPMNAASIIAIVISAVVLVVVIIIIIKLRKRISVK